MLGILYMGIYSNQLVWSLWNGTWRYSEIKIDRYPPLKILVYINLSMVLQQKKQKKRLETILKGTSQYIQRVWLYTRKT